LWNPLTTDCADLATCFFRQDQLTDIKCCINRLRVTLGLLKMRTKRVTLSIRCNQGRQTSPDVSATMTVPVPARRLF
jgi:hypothetical protein